MDNTFTTEATAEEAAQMKNELDYMLSELKRMRPEVDRAQKEISASQARTEVILQDIRTLMNTLKETRC